MSLTIGIVGLPNVGKSTLFNALTKNDVLAANYPFATIEPNVGVVGLPDARLDRAGRDLHDSQKILPAPVSFVDIAGPGPRRVEGPGPGQRVPGQHPRRHARSARSSGPSATPTWCTSTARSRPGDDIETINTELILADLQTVDKALPRLEKEARVRKDRAPVARRREGGGRAARRRHHAVRRRRGRRHRAGLLAELHLLTTKPFLYVFNVDEAELANAAFLDELRALVAPAEAVFMDAKIESELIDLPDDEARELLASIGQNEPGLNQLIRVGFRTLGLQTYLTAGPEGVARLDDPGRRHRPGGRRVIHTDFQRGFIKAEVVSYDDLDRGGLDGGGQGGRQGPHRGQGLRHARRRRGRVPLQRLTSAAAAFMSRLSS